MLKVKGHLISLYTTVLPINQNISSLQFEVAYWPVPNFSLN